MLTSIDLDDFQAGTHELRLENGLTLTLRVTEEFYDDFDEAGELQFTLEGDWEEIAGESERDGYVHYHDDTPLDEEVLEFIGDQDMTVCQYLADNGIEWTAVHLEYPNGGEEYRRFLHPDDCAALRAIIARG